jgi:hypothetical protein
MKKGKIRYNLGHILHLELPSVCLTDSLNVPSPLRKIHQILKPDDTMIAFELTWAIKNKLLDMQEERF